MFAPRLLVSPDLVPRAALVGLESARSARLVCRAGHGVDSETTPTDGITQRDIYTIVQLEDSHPRTQVHATSIGGTREVHRVADTPVPHRSASRGSAVRSPARKTVRLSMRAIGQGPDECCGVLDREARRTCSASLVAASRTQRGADRRRR
jgi:hypothetical protein